MKLTTLDALYVDLLKEILEAENLLARTLPRLAKAATAPELRSTLTEQLHQTQARVHRLDQIFLRLGTGGKGGVCRTMDCIIAESKDLVSDQAKPTLEDAALIIFVRRMEHFVVAGYGSLLTMARQLGHAKATASLQETLDELQAADTELSDLAQSIVRGGTSALSKQP